VQKRQVKRYNKFTFRSFIFYEGQIIIDCGFTDTKKERNCGEE